MYCPQCLHHTLEISDKGTIKVVVNGKMRDSGVFLFNTERDSEDDIAENLRSKLEEFCRWYMNFQNREPILSLVLSTRDARCRNQCTMPSTFHTSVINVIISKERVQEVADQVGEKFGLNIIVKDIDDEVDPSDLLPSD